MPQLKAEIITIEQNNTVLENQIVLLIVENQEFKNQLEELLENITVQNNELAIHIQEIEETNRLYTETLESYLTLLQTYHDLLLEYQGISKPLGEMIVIAIPGIVNGDWSNGNEGWLTQGVSNLVGGVKFLHENERGTYSTQTVYLDDNAQGIQFDIKPQPFGGEITIQVSLKGIIVYEQVYSGTNSNYDWETLVLPFDSLMTMRAEYGFTIEDYYDIRFTVKPGENTGSNIAIDNVTLVELSYE